MPTKRDYTTPWETGSLDFNNSTRPGYLNPFFDLGKFSVPSKIKILFKYCRGFFYTNGFVRNIISKLAEYPITEILFDHTEDADIIDKYEDLFKNTLYISKLLISIGLDYYTYGNCFVSANLNFKRYLTCTSCNESTPISKVKYKFKNFMFEGICPKCKANNAPFSIEDITIRNKAALNFVRWAPENIEIDYDEITGQAKYYYKLSAKRKKQIIGGVKYIVETTPKIFLQALKSKKSIELDPKNLYHFKRPTLAEQDGGWGKPIILPAIKDIYYLTTLKRGNEAIAKEHIIPKKAIFPSANSALDPYSQMNLAKWKTEINSQIIKWRRDPNHIGVFPIPIGYQELGGNAKALLITQEIRFLEENIINSVGLPVEFIKGGTTWTGSSISLRIVENHFTPYREMMNSFLNYFVIPKISSMLQYPKIKIKLQKLRMTDDSQAKQLIMNLNTNKKISDETLLDEFGINSTEERNRMKKDLNFITQLDNINFQAQAKAQGEAGVISARYQAKAQAALEDESFRTKETLFNEEVALENPNTHIDSSEIIDKLAVQLMLLPEQQQQQALDDLVKRAPVTAGFVIERFLARQAMMTSSGEEEDDPGFDDNVKEEDKVKSGPDKQKGPTKGSP